MSKWYPTHVSAEDGSEARLVHSSETGTVIMENEEGTQWTDPASDWTALDGAVYSVILNEDIIHTGHDLSVAARTWDSKTYLSGGTGGVAVRQYQGGLCVRDGWILHVRENGAAYLSPHLALA